MNRSSVWISCLNREQTVQQVDLWSDSNTDLNLNQILELWLEAGWIRSIDMELALHLSELYDNQSAWAGLALVLVSHQLGRGHSCVDVHSLYKDPDRYLALPPEFAKLAGIPLPSELFKQLTKSEWLDAVHQSPLMGLPDENTPLIFDHERLYLRRMWQVESRVAERLKQRLSKPSSNTDSLEKYLNQLFPNDDASIDWQREACAKSAIKRFSVITGGPGTGKTTTVVKLLALLKRLADDHGDTFDIALAAPTGKAAARLSSSIGSALERLPEGFGEGLHAQVDTVHRLIGVSSAGRRNRYHKGHTLAVDLLIVDEASMLDIELFDALLDALSDRTQLILLGDKDQLASVEAGSVLADLCRVESDTNPEGFVSQLKISHRFNSESGIGQLAKAVNQGSLTDYQAVWRQTYSDIHYQTGADLRQQIADRVLSSDPQIPGYTSYLGKLTQPCCDPLEVLRLFDHFRLLTPLRRGPEGVESLNHICETLLARKGLIDLSQEWYIGRPVMVTANDYAVGLANGDVGVCLEREGKPSVAFINECGDAVRWIDPLRLESVETAYAMTVHKSQGSEFKHVAYLSPSRANPVLSRELLYTAITRASSQFTLIEMNSSVTQQTISTQTDRASGLYHRLTD
nr:MULTISPECIES: exodeoxyribonuclease V subunit alpha [unclassified Marinobacterium]